MPLLSNDSKLEWDGYHNEDTTAGKARAPGARTDTNSYNLMTNKIQDDCATTKDGFYADDVYEKSEILKAFY